MSEWLMAAVLFFAVLATGSAVLAAVFAGLGLRAHKRRENDWAELEKRLQERVNELGAELGKSREAVIRLEGALGGMSEQMARVSEESKNSAEKIRAGTENALGQFRQETSQSLRNMRGDINQSLKDSRESGENSMNILRASVDEKLVDSIREVGKIRDKTIETLESVRAGAESNLNKLRESMENRLDQMGRRIDAGLKETRDSSEKKLDQIRNTVDEKLQTTLERRLTEQFGVVSARLDNVHKGLGKMEELASNVGDLQRVLTSARDRGQWGEVVLKDIIRQILTPDQYQENVGFGGGERVEFAIRVPVEGGIALLPVDSKFPMDNYERLVAAEKNGEDSSAYRRALLNSIRNSAKDIRAKYIHPPRSTDFAFLFLPTEGLYAVVAGERGLLDEIQQVHKVRVVGPDSFALFLSAVRMGFQLFAAGRRANEIREILGAVKTEFGKFGEVLGRVKKNLEAATNNIGRTETRVGVMTRTLRGVEALSDADAAKILAPDSPEAQSGERE